MQSITYGMTGAGGAGHGRSQDFFSGGGTLFQKVFKKFSKENCEKCIILAYFSKRVNTLCVNFCAFGRKTQIVGKF